MSHTPGPWTVERMSDNRTGTLIRSSRIIPGAVLGAGVAKVLDWKYVGSFEEREANARLLAAAPDLLSALKECVGIFNPVLANTEWGQRVERANAAIAKAEKPTP